MSTAKALIIDDEPDIRELLELTLAKMELATSSAADVTEAKALLDKDKFHICITDMRLPDGTGIDVVKYIQENHPQIPVAVLTAHGNMELAIESLKAGAFDFVSKPVDLAVLRRLVNTAIKMSNAGPKQDRRSRKELLGDSDAMQKTRATISKLARSQAPVYISGESGVGKELVARLIHEKGPRKEAPFVPVNCGAIPTELMESELFGHKKGSFTGASANKDGLFKTADGGTLFLDEVAELPMHMQVKLLRAIQEKAIRAVGDQTESTVDVRILSATHKDLGTLVDEGKFRQDLFYRLNVIELKVPPLRQRVVDIPVLAQNILDRLNDEYSDEPAELSESAIEALKAYHFPGNVRELENILERAITLCDSNTIDTSDLHLQDVTDENFDSEAFNSTIPKRHEDVSLDEFLENIEKEAILDALDKTNNNKTAAAKLLGISFRALRYKLKKLEID